MLSEALIPIPHIYQVRGNTAHVPFTNMHGAWYTSGTQVPAAAYMLDLAFLCFVGLWTDPIGATVYC